MPSGFSKMLSRYINSLLLKPHRTIASAEAVASTQSTMPSCRRVSIRDSKQSLCMVNHDMLLEGVHSRLWLFRILCNIGTRYNRKGAACSSAGIGDEDLAIAAAVPP
jgi:hypothetical protein